jgi:hypothetical protein
MSLVVSLAKIGDRRPDSSLNDGEFVVEVTEWASIHSEQGYVFEM